MGKYAEDPAWSDITPLPTDEGGSNPLAAIAYSAEYEETMSYLRAVMAANEYSSRVLDLTEDLIDMNPAHYTVWLYRAKCLEKLDWDLKEELDWLNEIALVHLKNYQIWHHRNLVVDMLAASGWDGEGETDFVAKMFEQDAKNYHVWSYRQWLVRRFDLWHKGELEFTEEMLNQDVRNNSAWNHRWFTVNGREDSPGVAGDEEVRTREIEFAKKAIEKAPHNESAWNYLRGILNASRLSLSIEKAFAAQYATLDPECVRSSFALDFVADALAEDGNKQDAGRALELLKKYDPVRRHYWEYMKGQLGVTA